MYFDLTLPLVPSIFLHLEKMLFLERQCWFEDFLSWESLITCRLWWRRLEMSTCGGLVGSEWSRLAIFKEVTTTVWRLMAHVIFLAKTKPDISKYIKKSKNKYKKIGMSVLRIPDARMRAFCMCLCVCVCVANEASGWKVLNMDRDPYSQKAFYRWGHWCRIFDQAPLVHKIESLLKGKTYRGAAPIVCCWSSSTKHIQINKISQSRQWDCSLKVSNCRLGTSSCVEQRGLHRSTGLFTYTSPQAGLGWGLYNLTELC